jgi:iron complex outermembrane recepter protein
MTTERKEIHMFRVRLRVAASLMTTLGMVCGGGALAQQSPSNAPTAPAAELEEVVVTGSRIPVPANVTATSPLQVVTSQDLTLSGKTDITDLLNGLPQNVIGTGVDFGNTSSPLTATGGFTTADLRGLGPQRTLVLVDGKRLGAGDPSTSNPNPAPDLDQIPTSMIERVEVVTGGASATYGSDAVAGVINFILKKNFEGVQIDGQYGFYQHNQHNAYIEARQTASGFAPPTGNVRDGDHRDLSILMGTNLNDGAGNVTGYFIYHNQDAIPGGNRDFSNCQAYTNTFLAGVATPGFTCLGSSNSNRFITNGGQGLAYSVVGNQFMPYPAAGSNPPAHFNFPAYEYLQRQDERYLAGFQAHLDVNSAVKPYLNFSFMNDRTSAVVAPSGLFQSSNPATGDNAYLVNCSNPLLSAQEAATICTPAQIAADTAAPGSVNADLNIGRRNIEGGGRDSRYEHTNFRVVGGVQGNLGSAWSYDAYGQYYYTTAFSENLNYLNYSAISSALQVTGTAANPVCISGGTCVPYNIFTTGAVTPAQLHYLYSPGTSQGNNTEEVAHADLTGDLGQYGVKTPWARDAVGINLGVEHRYEALSFAPDAEELSGQLAGFSGASVAIDRGYSVKEAFVEARAPLIQNAPAAYDLTVDAGYRYSDYSTAGKTNTFKFELQYAPVQDVRLRFSFDRAVRAPNLIELYNPQSYGQTTAVTSDPCAPTNNGATAAVATLAACEHTGVTPAQYGNGIGVAAGGTNTIIQCVSGQCGQVVGGNPKLSPEVANTWSLGLSFTPTAMPNLTGSIDYYHILLKQEVGTIPAAVILSNCLATGDPTYCSQIVRNAVTGALTGANVASGGYFLQTSINTGTALVSGVDLQTNYHYPLPDGWGSLNATLSGTWFQHNTTTPYPGAVSFDCAGLFGNTCGNSSVNPKWRHNLRLTWDTPWKVLLSAQWRYIGRTGFDNNDSNPQLFGQELGIYEPYLTHIAPYSYLDLSGVWKVAPGFQIRAGINNLFDKDPPFIPSGDISGNSGGINSYQTYDLQGRQVFVAFTAKF